MFGDVASRVAAGNFLKVPLLVGSTQHEEDIFVVAEELLPPSSFAQPLVTELSADLLTYVRFPLYGIPSRPIERYNLTDWFYLLCWCSCLSEDERQCPGLAISISG